MTAHTLPSPRGACRRRRRLLRRLGALVLLAGLAAGGFLCWGRRLLPRPAVRPGEAAYLLDCETGEVLLAQNADEPRAVASLTKLMTALMLAESGVDLQAAVTVPGRLADEFDAIRAAGGVTMDLVPGETLRWLDLLYGLLLPSANDAASVIADGLGGGSIAAFVAQMNARALQLGCADTRFSCPHGLYDAGNVSTARDIARIAQACFANETLRRIACTPRYTLPATNAHGARELRSTNPMLDPESGCYRPYLCGGKTGYTREAGRCLAVFAPAGGHCYGLVVLGSTPDALYSECAALLDWVRLTRCTLPELLGGEVQP